MTRTGDLLKKGVSAFESAITAEWGNITGDMTSQTDLNDALNGKMNNVTLATVATSGDYNDLTNKPTIPSIDGLATETYVNNGLSFKVDNVDGKGLSSNDYTDADQVKLNTLANVAVSGSYNDLSNKPTIPSIAGLATETYVDNAVVNKVDKIADHSLMADSEITRLANVDNYDDSEVRGLIQSNTDAIASITGLEIKIVAELPATGKNGVIYLVGTESPYDEYIWVSSSSHFEMIGSSAVDLDDYYTSAQVNEKLLLKVNVGDLADVATSGSYTDLTSRPNLSTVSSTGSYTDLINKPTIPSIAGLATETYVNNAVDSKQDTLVSGTNIKTINGSSVLGSGDIVVEAEGAIIADEASPVNISKVWAGTQSQYDALTTKANTTLYFIKE